MEPTPDAVRRLVSESAVYLAQRGCASIRYRVRVELLGEPPSHELARLQDEILRDPLVARVLATRQPDGWLGVGFHADGGAEPGIRLLREKGVEASHPAILWALS